MPRKPKESYLERYERLKASSKAPRGRVVRREEVTRGAVKTLILHYENGDTETRTKVGNLRV